jgi:two-component system, NtrC family, sensor kinase
MQVEIERAFSHALHSLISIPEFARAGLDQLTHHFRGADIGLALLNRNENSLFPVWSAGEPKEIEAFESTRGELWTHAEKFLRTDEQILREDLRAIKIFFGEGVVGALVLRGANQSQINFAESIAVDLGQSAKQVIEFSDVHRLKRELNIINRISKALSSYLEMDRVLASTMQAVWELFSVESAFLVLMEFRGKGGMQRIPLNGDFNSQVWIKKGFDQGIVGHCIRHQATAIVDDVALDARYDPLIDGLESFETRSLLCVPLLVREQGIGALVLVNKIETSFNRHDLTLLVTLAASVGVAVENARLFRDLSDANGSLKVSQREIERSRSVLMTLFDNLDDELYIISRKYNVVAVNQSRADRVGIEPKKLVGKKCYEVLENRDSPCPDCLAGVTFKDHLKTKRLHCSVSNDNRRKEQEIYTYPIYGRDGIIRQTILQHHDITDRRDLEASLIQAEKLAAVGQLAAGVVHELNNPLTAVLANSELLRRELGKKVEKNESLELIEHAGRRAQDVLRELLDFARQETPTFRATDINETIRQALSLVERQWEKTCVQLDYNLAPDIPRIDGNGDHLMTVWINLLVNARDSLDDRPGMIRIDSFLNAQDIVIQVTDSGGGIPEDQIDRIFDPFFTTKERGKGTGLGLATSFRIVEQHGGSIHVNSRKNEGTVMTVRLPKTGNILRSQSEDLPN